ncbi:38.7K protein [Gynaephora ruoergensis nucleopolyhedrovirus]|nr:38.7K protein [Gynaephora ruoergensis nucleopolyhedrovirus]
MFNILNNLFNIMHGKKYDKKETTTFLPKLPDFSYLFKQKKIIYNEHVKNKSDVEESITIKYFVKNKQVWMSGRHFAHEIGFENVDYALDRCVDFHNARPIAWLLTTGDVEARDNGFESDQQDKCINKLGALQLLDNIEFDNKAKFIICLLETINMLESANEKEQRIEDEKLSKILNAVELANENNTNLNVCYAQLINKLGEFESRFNDQLEIFNKKIDYCNNIEVLYSKLREYHCKIHNGKIENADDVGNLSFLSEKHHSDNDVTEKKFKMRFPKNSAKHPRLAVYVKPSDDDSGATEIALLAGQQKNVNVRKRHYKDMELVVDRVHPNPLLALNCLDEDLQNSNFNFLKKTKRSYQIDCGIEAVKRFIHDSV